ncbi:PaaI family thioesterase [Alkalicoccobacillus porphyridii]|uniref:PaaI family thioesterase n=1 Tax=Alkalicoccobacillus porphyridii TaxID=2597270 RepID=A0A553ZXW9_9BACI|nr:PaaI family thioesterase [Alkalicoccobacillus porphyridii]TSB46299.1 PaaI family thioesterase [Alkalicoccobacillus porphyridii]
MEDTKKQTVEAQINTYVQSASKADLEILSHIVENLQQKKDSKESYLSALVNMKQTMRSGNELEMTIPIHPIIHNSLNMVHGGITATLADSAMGSLVHQLLPDGQTAVTTNLSVQYIRPGIGESLTCIASVTHQGKQLCVTEARVYNHVNKLIATAHATFAVILKK